MLRAIRKLIGRFDGKIVSKERPVPEALFSGARVRYDVAGSGDPALLLVPGWCDT